MEGYGNVGISPKTRDSHIATASATGPLISNMSCKNRGTSGCGKVKIQNQDSHFSTPANRLRRKVKTSYKTTQKGGILRHLANPHVQDHPVLVLAARGETPPFRRLR